MIPFYAVDIFPIYLLVFTRILGLTISSPIFSSTLVPRRFIMTMVVFIAIICFPLVDASKGYTYQNNIYEYILHLVNEFIIGLAIGLFLNIIFTAFQMSAQFFSFQMGLGISQVVDPLSMIQAPVLSQFYYIFATFIFIVTNGLEYLILVIVKSFDIINWVNISSKFGNMLQGVMELVSDFFIISLQIAIPIMLTLLIVNIILGVIAKFAPQINIFMIGINITMIIGLILVFMYMPIFASIADRVFENMFIRKVVKWMEMLSFIFIL